MVENSVKVEGQQAALRDVAEKILDLTIEAKESGLEGLYHKLSGDEPFLLKKGLHLYSRSVTPQQLFPVLQNYIFRGSYIDDEYHQRVMILETLPFLSEGEKNILDKIGEALGDDVKLELAEERGIDISEPAEGDKGDKGDNAGGDTAMAEPDLEPSEEAPEENQADTPDEGEPSSESDDDDTILMTIDFRQEFQSQKPESEISEVAESQEAPDEPFSILEDDGDSDEIGVSEVDDTSDTDEEEDDDEFDLSTFVNQIWEKEPISDKTLYLEETLGELPFDVWAKVIPELAQSDAREFICALSGSSGNAIALVMRYLQEMPEIAEMVALSLSEQGYPEEYVVIAQESLVEKVKASLGDSSQDDTSQKKEEVKIRGALLTEGLAGKIGNPGFDTVEAERMVLHYLDLCMRIKKDGPEVVESWLARKGRPEVLKRALAAAQEKSSPVLILSDAQDKLRETKMEGAELFEDLLAKEGACLIAEGVDSFYLYEYLASLFGESYYGALKESIRRLAKTG